MIDTIVSEALRRHAPRTALADTTRSFSYAELDAFATELAADLRPWLSAGRPTRVGLLAGNSAEYVAIYLALLRSGCVPFLVDAAATAKTKGVKRIGPFAVPKAMCSGPSATLATWFKIRGINYSIASACATSTHCIGAGYEQILMGKQDVVFAGGCEELDWTLSCLFDAMGAMSSGFNDTPERASRPYDIDRDGFVIAGGAGMVVLEDLERARARGATIHAEIVGYAANSDGHDMVAPSGEGAARCMRLAMAGAGNRKVDYLNPHGTGTPIGDLREMGAVREVFGDAAPLISSTKALTGHSLGAAGAQEAIYSVLMMQSGFAAESAHIDTLDPAFEDLPILRQRVERPLETVMSNSFGFGGTNGALIMARAD